MDEFESMLAELRRAPVALSIRQPWADRILFDGKDIENRSWRTNRRGAFLIHAGKQADADEADAAAADRLRGGIVGMARIVDCVRSSDSRWFAGPWGFVLRRAYPLEFVPCRGRLDFFVPDIAAARLALRGTLDPAPGPELDRCACGAAWAPHGTRSAGGYVWRCPACHKKTVASAGDAKQDSGLIREPQGKLL